MTIVPMYCGQAKTSGHYIPWLNDFQDHRFKAGNEISKSFEVL